MQLDVQCFLLMVWVNFCCLHGKIFKSLFKEVLLLKHLQNIALYFRNIELCSISFLLSIQTSFNPSILFINITVHLVELCYLFSFLRDIMKIRIIQRMNLIHLFLNMWSIYYIAGIIFRRSSFCGTQNMTKSPPSWSLHFSVLDGKIR